jgi:glyceraldehyde 3-phosphate dehydrogenase
VTIDGTRLPFVGNAGPVALPLDGVDVVIDCTGVFKTEAALAPYFAPGVKKVVCQRAGEGRR